MVLTATADHRIVDGAHAAQLATYLRAAFADPAAADAPAPLSEVR
jgi:pyruvate/2-oxoglutarate dehydrogenase complex dihydrolipoamide acyltransferase (E2) component